MKYFALLILPKGTNIDVADSIEKVASKMMAPFKMGGDEIPACNGHWDYYWCCTKEWMYDSRRSYTCYSGILGGHAYVIFPAEELTDEGVTDSVITPDGQWHRSKATYTEDDATWSSKALEICHAYHGHFVVLLYCHG